MLIPLLSLLAASAAGAPTASQTVVRASTGYYAGQVNQNYSNVREFLNVPYGQTTSGKNRFMPPLPVPASSNEFDATQFCPSCPQYVSSKHTIWTDEIPQYLVYWGNDGNTTAGASATFTTEECLSVAIWTPANATAASSLPVAMFWTGGGYQTNGILVPGQLPQRWVSRTQAHVVVTINYRMNIMGFPSAAGLQQPNLGLLDQRLATEWVRDNIRAFGGDPSKIMIWGQSAGAGSVDYYNYAYWTDPIAHAIFAQSGNSLAGGSSTDYTGSNFTSVARGVGCDFPSNATAELECMQGKDYNEIINFMGSYQDRTAAEDLPAISFNPIADEKIVFANNMIRYKQGFVSQVPMIYSSAANEGGSLSPYNTSDPLAGHNQSAANAVTERILCGAANSTLLRHEAGLTTYRYQYAGNWTNQDPLPWMGAFHSSDLVMLFGTYNDGVAESTQPLEAQTSEMMEDMVLAFMRDPYEGPGALGWLPFDPQGESGGTGLVRFGAYGKAVANVTGDEVEAVCFGKGEYDPFP
jgi:carboxylesterase type B